MAFTPNKTLVVYYMLVTLFVQVMGNVCNIQPTFSCSVKDEELPDKTIGTTCVCASADCIPPTNPCHISINNIKFEDATFQFIAGNSFSNYSKLNSIDIQSGILNYTQTMAFDNQQSLKMLRIAGNKIQIEKGAFNGLESLENLQFQPNFVSLSSDVFTGIGSALTNLDLGSGMVKELSNKTFDKIVNLNTLSIANNQIIKIKKEWFSRLTNLEELNLSGNLIQNVPSFIFSLQTKLKRLYLPENNITFLEQGCFDGLESLEELVLSGNRIRYLDGYFRGLKNLTKLIINDNLLRVIIEEMFTGLTSLTKLSLSGNSIVSIAMASLQFPNLEVLDLSRNALSNLLGYYFEDLPKISHINLGYNKINEIANGTFSSLTVLKYLFLEYNQLATFSFYDFGNENKLQRLSLQNNLITSISFSSILQQPQLMNLDILWLENNKLQTFPSVIFDYAPSLAINRNSLQLTNNPLTCDCNIKELSESTRNIILDPQIRADCIEEPTCSIPTTMVNYENITLPVGEETSLFCKATGQPHPLVSWTYNNEVVIKGWYNSFTGTSQIFFDKLSTSDFGNYTCTATNIVGSSSITMNLIEKKVKYQNAGENEGNDPNRGTSYMPSGIYVGNFVFLTFLVTNFFRVDHE